MWYSIASLTVRSDLPLPAPMLERHAPLAADLSVHLCADGAQHEVAGAAAAPPAERTVRGQRGAVWRDARGTWVWRPHVGALHAAADGRAVDVFPEDGASLRSIGRMVVSDATTILLHRRGELPLVARLAPVEGGAAAVLGPAGGQLVVVRWRGEAPYVVRCERSAGTPPSEPAPLKELRIAAARLPRGTQGVKRAAVLHLLRRTALRAALSPEDAACLLTAFARLVSSVPVRFQALNIAATQPEHGGLPH